MKMQNIERRRLLKTAGSIGVGPSLPNWFVKECFPNPNQPAQQTTNLPLRSSVVVEWDAELRNRHRGLVIMNTIIR